MNVQFAKNTTTGMFLYWCFITVQWVPNHRELRIFDQI